MTLAENSKSFLLTACVLHNFLSTMEPNCLHHLDMLTQTLNKVTRYGIMSNPPSVSWNTAVSSTAQR